MDKLLGCNTKLLAFLRTLLFSYIISGLLLFLLAFLMLKINLSGAIVSGGIIAIYVLSCFTGGFIMGKNSQQRRFVWGLITGLLYFLILIILSAIMNTFTGMNPSRMISVLFICSFSGMLGGMLS